MKLLHGHGRYQSGRVLRGHGLTGTAIEALATGMTLASVKGVWLDPSDTGTLYQDAAGTTPVTAPGQTVGLILDKFSWGGKTLSQVLDGQAELVTNGGFDTDTTGWAASANATLSVVSGAMNIQAVANGSANASQTLTGLVVGQSYRLSFDVAGETQSTGTPNYSVFGNAPVPINASGSYSTILTADNTSEILVFALGDAALAGEYLRIDNVTVKHIPGHHASQPDAAKRPKYRRGDARGVVNLLTWTQDFSNAAWVKAGWSPVGTTTAPDGSEVSTYAFGTDGYIYQDTPPVAIGLPHTTSIYIKANKSATVGLRKPNGSLSDNAAISLNTEWQKFEVSATTSASPARLLLDNRVGNGYGTAGLEVALWQPQLEQASTASAYQRVDANLGGIPAYNRADLHWLEFDGQDDFLSTASIDFTASDEMTVVAGVRKLSDAAAGMLAEFSANVNTNAGSFYLTAPEKTAASGDFSFKTRGSVNPALPAFSGPILAPITGVATGIGDISADDMTIRFNGVHKATEVLDQGTGSFGSYPLYIGMRAGTTLPLKGWLYGLFITGKVLDASQLSVAEQHAGKKAARAIA